MGGAGNELGATTLTRTLKLTLALSLLTSVPAFARFDGGNDLLRICEDPRGEMLCLGTVIGHYDMMEAWGFACGSAPGVTKSQVKDIVVKYLRDNPSQRHQPAAFLSAEAITKAFSCRPPKGLEKLFR